MKHQKAQAAYTPGAAHQWSEVHKYNAQKTKNTTLIESILTVIPQWGQQQNDKVSSKSIGGREF